MLSFGFRSRRVCSLGIVAMMVAALLPISSARAQSAVQIQIAPSSSEDVPLKFSGDATSVPSAPSFHILPANTDAGRRAPLDWPATGVKPSMTRGAVTVKPSAALPKPGFFPADLSYFGGLVLRSGGSVNIYDNCANESCWGDPEGFLSNLANSKFIHVVDQYIGLKTNKRYPLSGTGTTTSSTTFISAAEIQSIVESAAQQVGPHIFHVFLPQGVETCLDSSDTACYSPSGNFPFVFCAYHSSDPSNSPDLIYTVEPFQDVPGCVLTGPNPNSAMSDSTNSALSHELFELITDPFGSEAGGSAWRAENSQLEQGQEIGDICHGPGDGAGGTIVPTYQLLRGVTYQTQLEYSNFRHGCVVAPEV